MAQPLMAKAPKMPQTRQGAKVLPLREEQPRRLQPVTSGTSEPGDALDNMAETLDRGVHAGRALDLRPVARGARRAYLDWVAHLAFSPGKQAQLFGKALRKSARLGNYAIGCCVSGGRGEPCIDPLPQDRRFSAEEWQGWPYNFLHQSFVLQQQWWHNATTDVDGVTRQHENVIEFASRQILDMMSPSNFSHKPGCAGEDIADRRAQSRRGCAQLPGRLGTSATQQAAGWGGEVQGRERGRGHAR